MYNELLAEKKQPAAKEYAGVSLLVSRDFQLLDSLREGVITRRRVGGNAAGRYTGANRLTAQDDFLKMLENEKLDTLVVTTIDYTHDLFIVPALERGIKVLTEKPMTT